MKKSFDYDLLIIGAGPGGYVAAIRAAQLGLNTCIIEKEEVGGVCLNWGCIPSKAIITQAKNVARAGELEELGIKVDRSGFLYERVHKKSRQAAQKLSKGIAFLLKKNKITLIEGHAAFSGKNTLKIEGNPEGINSLSAEHIIIATGSRPRSIPAFQPDGKTVLTSKDLLNLTDLPKSLIILGGGAIGIEFAFIMNSFGVTVDVVEMTGRIIPGADREATDILRGALKKQGVRIHTSARALAKEIKEGRIHLKISKANKEEYLTAEKMLVAVGRAPNTENLNLEAIGIKTDRGFIPVGDFYKTTCDTVYAIGDVIPTPQLAHLASKEGETAVEHIKGKARTPGVSLSEVPYGVYSEPQVAGFGMTEEKAEKSGAKKAVFPYRGAGKAVAIGEVEGIVKILFDPATEEILGAHICGADATELIHELLLAKKSELLLEDIARMIHAHPTLSETVMEAARMGQGWAIHV